MSMRRDVAAAVAADIDDQGFLANLGVEILDELVEALGAHVGDMEVADLAVGGLADVLDVVLDPVVVVELLLAGDGDDGDGRGRLRRWAGR